MPTYTLLKSVVYGLLLVARQGHQLYSLYPGHDETALLNMLAKDWPRLNFQNAQADSFDLNLQTHLESAPFKPFPAAGYCFDHKTAFEQDVLQALIQIPAGKTQSYKSLAERLGKPTAIRAVARACSKNRIAFLIPCHRIVGSDGALKGYRWGIDLKETLLKKEHAFAL